MSRMTSTPRPPVSRFHDLDEILFAVVDGARSAEAFARRAFLCAARGREHLVATRVQQLDRRRADAAGAAMDQHALARLEPRGVHQIGPDREMHFRQRRGVDQR